MRRQYYIYGLCIVFTMFMSSCFGDLDQEPQSENSLTEVDVFETSAQAKKALAKLYASLAITGQQGPAGSADIAGIDEGTTSFTRLLFMMNELPADLTVNGFADVGLPNFNTMSWGAGNGFNEGMYYRLGQTVSFCNSFIENAQALYGDSEVQYFIAEARFIRAFAYYYLMDLYGDVPLETQVSESLPEQKTRKEIFNFVESELVELADILKASGTNEYGRVDQVAAWALLSRLYLNAEVYTGESKYDECITYSDKVIASSYSINTTDANSNGSAYDELFCADNNTNGAQKEMIFTANYDGNNSQTYGGTTFLVCANWLTGMSTEKMGIAGGWNGNKVTPELVGMFTATASDGGSPTAWSDARAMFASTSEGRIFTIDNISQDEQGYGSYKFTNVRTDGGNTSDPGKVFADTDYPLIRMGEIYLNYAEAVLRGGAGGSGATAVSYVNELRSRANASTVSSIDLNYVLDERARELYFEGFRRTDLIRYGLFTSADYLWTFKGGTKEGKAVDSKYKLFPIPTSILNANENMKPTPGY